MSAFSNAAREFLGGAPAKAKEWYKNPSVLGPLGLVMMGALFPVYMTSFQGVKYRGAGLVSTAVQQFTETISESGARPAPGGAGPSFSWGGPDPPPTPGITVCPVSGGDITQEPYDQTGSHANLNAYDFGLAQGSPVVAAHDGYIVSVRTTFAPNEYQAGSYGNYVLMVGTNPQGARFFTMYAHLMPDIPGNIIAAAGTTTLIAAGTHIGNVDTTGYTYGWRGIGTGTHLHFGYQGPGTLALPPGCP
jgi:murein DD-endopeptidase MepM/ murein hydrolase activator NlpD